MLINSQKTEVMELPPEWSAGIPSNADLTFTILSDVIEGQTRIYPTTRFRDGFIYHQPTVESLAELFEKTVNPMTDVIDAIYRDRHDVPDDWVLEHYITARHGAGNVAVSLQREWLRMLASRGYIWKPDTVLGSSLHRDHSDGNDDWVLYEAVQGQPTGVLEGPLVSILDGIHTEKDIQDRLTSLLGSRTERFPEHLSLERIAKWLFIGTRAMCSASYRAQAHLPGVSASVINEDTLNEMDSETVHWRPRFRIPESKNRIFYRDILTKLINKAQDPERYEQLTVGLEPEGTIVVTERAVGI